MNNEDRYHTTSWDGEQVRRQSDQGAARPAQSGGQKKKKKRKKKRTNPFLAFILWVVIVVASSAILAGVGWMLANDLCALNKEAKEIDFVVPEEWMTGVREVTNDDGATEEVAAVDMAKVAAALKEQGMIEYDWFFRLFSLVIHGDQKVGVGTYKLNTEMDYRALIYGMIPSRNAYAETVDVTIPEGYTVEQIIQLLAENNVNTVEELTEAAEDAVFEGYAFLDEENVGSVSRLEGYLYPDTYNFYVGGKPEVALRAMLDNFDHKVYGDAEISTMLEERPEYSLEDVIIIASLIEKETDGSDRDKIASVIYNRLENTGETNHLLQIDAALVYAAGRPITQEDYSSLDSPYNLYQHTGLPPTAISNPGRASILAALQPASTNYYYYVLGSDDKHIFSATLAEHNAVLAGLK